MQETWRAIEETSGRYSVSDFGRVRNNISGRILKPGCKDSGHVTVVLGRKLGTRAVHMLVMKAFRGSPPSGFECRHLNGNPSDNRLHNLEWSSRKTNAQDRCIHRGKGWKLTVEQAAEIKRDLGRVSEYKLAKKYGVWPNSIRNIRIGRAFANVAPLSP